MSTIARGGWFGVKLGKAAWSNSYLPLAHSDSVFATIAESLVFVGTLPILINRVRDWQRRQAVRARFTRWLRPGDRDPLEAAPGPPATRPPEILMAEETMGAIDAGLRALPARQREAFALRCLEGMDLSPLMKPQIALSQLLTQVVVRLIVPPEPSKHWS